MSQTRQIETYAAGAGLQDNQSAAADDFSPWNVTRDAAIFFPPT